MTKEKEEVHMITGIWVRPDDPDENDCLIVRYSDEDTDSGTWTVLIDGNGDALPLEGDISDTWLQIFPASDLHQSVVGDVSGTVTQTGNIRGSLTVNP